MTDTYKDAPQSITEIRAHRNESASAWTSRDVLVSLLRDIDNGTIAPDACVVFTRNEGRTNYRIASPDVETTLGMVEAGKVRVIRDAFLS